MTIAEAWDVLEAAGAIARAHGFECAPLITRRVLREVAKACKDRGALA